MGRMLEHRIRLPSEYTPPMPPKSDTPREQNQLHRQVHDVRALLVTFGRYQCRIQKTCSLIWMASSRVGVMTSAKTP